MFLSVPGDVDGDGFPDVYASTGVTRKKGRAPGVYTSTRVETDIASSRLPARHPAKALARAPRLPATSMGMDMLI